MFFDTATEERVQARAKRDGVSFSSMVNVLCERALAQEADQDLLPAVSRALRASEDEVVRRVRAVVEEAAEEAGDRVIGYIAMGERDG